jgi:hypothetical protein
MATQSQYEFFKLLYQDETDRYKELDERAKLYFTVISFYLGAVAFKLKDVGDFLKAAHVPVSIVIAIAACLTVAVALCVLGVQIRTYEGITEPRDVLQSYGEVQPTDGEFFDARIADFMVATERNSVQNDRVATYLALSGGAIALAMIIQIGIIVYLAITGGR